MEGLVLNHVEIPVENQDMEINRDMKINQDMEINQNKEARHHTQYII